MLLCCLWLLPLLACRYSREIGARFRDSKLGRGVSQWRWLHDEGNQLHLWYLMHYCIIWLTCYLTLAEYINRITRTYKGILCKITQQEAFYDTWNKRITFYRNFFSLGYSWQWKIHFDWRPYSTSNVNNLHKYGGTCCSQLTLVRWMCIHSQLPHVTTW